VQKDQWRVSLSEMSQQADGVLRRATYDEFDAAASPTFDELTESLFFSPGDGRIWLNDQRMFLLHAASFGALRQELIETLGIDGARELLTRIGYLSGARDANIIRRKWPAGDLASAFTAGPRLHSLEGIVKVTPVQFSFDIDRGSFFGEFLWHDSTEAGEHISAYGISTAPACWMQIGYASGYASAFMGKLIVYREVECAAMGHANCRNRGRPADEWDGDAADDLKYFNFYHTPRRSVTRRSSPSTNDKDPTGPLPAADGFRPDKNRIVGLSAALSAAHHMLERVAPTTAAVLFTGESGTGKELFANNLHAVSPRANKPFVAINCAAIPETLVEAELFGVERGAYTGAISSRAGRFERASTGTLFLDEVGALSLAAQGKLLRAIQEGEIERVGGSNAKKVDVRIVAATNIDLRAEVEARRFREDLFFRLNVFPIDLPPLRERRDDIPLLMDHFLALYSTRHRRRFTGFTRRAVEALLNYNYPGNIRELQNLIERGVIYAEEGGAIDSVHMFRRGELIKNDVFALGSGGLLQHNPVEGAVTAQTSRDLPTAKNGFGQPSAVDKILLDAIEGGIGLDDLESRVYAVALTKTKGNVSAAARVLRISRAQLDYRISKGGINRNFGQALNRIIADGNVPARSP
jgi:transcriptional regulator with GAF, ATPase, and Fis domain/predicted hydrocarbon binding protein